MIINRKRGSAVVSSLAAATLLSACVLPEDGYSYPQSASNYPQVSEPDIAPHDGCWSFTDTNGTRATNLVETLDENTLLVTPLRGAHKTRQYVRIGDNLYQDSDGSGTYQFGAGSGVWRSNDKNQTTFRMTHESRRC